MSSAPSHVSPLDLQRLIAANPGLVLLDVREPDEFAEGHIPGAINAPLGLLDPEVLFEGGSAFRNRPVYLVCRTSRRAAKAAAQFAAIGHAPTVIVDGGTLGWIAASLPVTGDASRGLTPQGLGCASRTPPSHP